MRYSRRDIETAEADAAQGTLRATKETSGRLRIHELLSVPGPSGALEQPHPLPTRAEVKFHSFWQFIDLNPDPQDEDPGDTTSGLSYGRPGMIDHLSISRHIAAPPDEGSLSDSGLGGENAERDLELARNTVTNYRVQWRNFTAWAGEKGITTLPADPAQVASYLADRIEGQGHRPATLRVAVSAIAYAHRAAGLDDPCSSHQVKRMLKCATRKAGRHQKQAEGLTAEALSAIESTARLPRIGRGGRYESQETANHRGSLDIALISLMRDAMLRVSEASALTWRDLGTEADGTGRLLIRCSKTDSEGQGAIAFVSGRSMSALQAIREGGANSESIFGLRPNQISERIKQAARAAGLGEGYSGHSPRVGMAQDLARAGTGLPSLMNAGRWRNVAMPAHYIRNETAGRGAVAQFHGYCGQAVR